MLIVENCNATMSTRNTKLTECFGSADLVKIYKGTLFIRLGAEDGLKHNRLLSLKTTPILST